MEQKEGQKKRAKRHVSTLIVRGREVVMGLSMSFTSSSYFCQNLEDLILFLFPYASSGVLARLARPGYDTKSTPKLPQSSPTILVRPIYRRDILPSCAFLSPAGSLLR